MAKFADWTPADQVQVQNNVNGQRAIWIALAKIAPAAVVLASEYASTVGPLVQALDAGEAIPAATGPAPTGLAGAKDLSPADVAAMVAVVGSLAGLAADPNLSLAIRAAGAVNIHP